MKNKNNNSITYKERASFYDVEYGDRRDKDMLKHFVGQAKSILEVPCGSGRNVDLYCDTNADVILIDIEQEMINMVKKKIIGYKNINCKVCNLLNLDLIDKFDLIILSKESIQLFVGNSEVESILSSLSKYLNESGIIFVDMFDFAKNRVHDDAPMYFNFDVHENTYFKNWSKGSITRWSKFAFENNILVVDYKYEINDNENYLMTSNIKLKNYTYLEFFNICAECGLTAEVVYGNYNFDIYTPDHNRMIFILRKG